MYGRKTLFRLLMVALVLVVGACSTDSPTAPDTGTGTPPSGGGSPSGNWKVKVDADPQEILVDTGIAGQPIENATIYVSVEDRTTGAFPDNGTLVQVATTLGSFGDVDGDGNLDTAVALSLQRGEGALLLYPGTTPGRATVQATLQGNTGAKDIQITLPAEPGTFYLSHITPTSSGAGGGGTATIVGEYIEEPVRVLFGGTSAQVMSVDEKKIKVKIPPYPGEIQPGDEQVVDIGVTVRYNTATAVTDSLPGVFTYFGGNEPPDFYLSSVAPNTGHPNGGEVVTIYGGAIKSPVRVTFEGVVAQVQSSTSSQITVLTPPYTGTLGAGETAPIDVAVTSGYNTTDAATDSLPSGFFYTYGGTVVQPTILSISPASGPNEGGTQVRIIGSGFQAPVQVFFGEGLGPGNFNGPEASVLSVTETQIVCVSPAATGFGQDLQNSLVDIMVVNQETGFSDVMAKAFSYGVAMIITSIAPNQGDAVGGTPVTIYGQGFDEPVAVEYGGLGQAIISVTGTEILTRSVAAERTPSTCGAYSQAGETSVTNIETGISATGPTFTYKFPDITPLITGVNPAGGSEAGGTAVTISGLNFGFDGMLYNGPVRVSFGSQAASSATANGSGTSISTSSPTYTGGFPTEACDDNTDGCSGTRNTSTSVDIRVQNLLTGCEGTFQGAFRYDPADTTCQDDLCPPAP